MRSQPSSSGSRVLPPAAPQSFSVEEALVQAYVALEEAFAAIRAASGAAATGGKGSAATGGKGSAATGGKSSPRSVAAIIRSFNEVLVALMVLAAVLVSLLECPGASGGGSPTAGMSTAPDEPDLDGRRRPLEEASGVLAALVALVAGIGGGGW